MGMDFEQVLRIDDYGVHARDVIRTAELCEGFAADVTELRELVDMLGIFGPEQCAPYWHVHTSDGAAHYMTEGAVEDAQRGQPTNTVCGLWERRPEVIAREVRRECTDGELWLPHCIWCVLRAGVFS
jgi:hypothetical protein